MFPLFKWSDYRSPLYDTFLKRLYKDLFKHQLKLHWNLVESLVGIQIPESSEYQTYITIPEFKGFKVRAKNNVIGWTIWILDQYSDPSKYTEMPWILVF